MVLYKDDVVNDSEAFLKAKAVKDRLLDYDRNSRQRTKVFDDASDWFSESQNPWLTRSQREDAARRQREKENREHDEKKKVYISLDSSGKIASTEAPSVKEAGAIRSAFEDWQYAADNARLGPNPELGNAQAELMTHLRENVQR